MIYKGCSLHPVSALAQCHIDKGVIKAEDLTAMIEELESYGSRGLGARMIARWVC